MATPNLVAISAMVTREEWPRRFGMLPDIYSDSLLVFSDISSDIGPEPSFSTQHQNRRVASVQGSLLGRSADYLQEQALNERGPSPVFRLPPSHADWILQEGSPSRCALAALRVRHSLFRQRLHPLLVDPLQDHFESILELLLGTRWRLSGAYVLDVGGLVPFAILTELHFENRASLIASGGHRKLVFEALEAISQLGEQVLDTRHHTLQRCIDW